MSYKQAQDIVIKHPELRTQMGSLFENAADIMAIPQEKFEAFYTEFVEMAVENFPELIDF